MAVSYGSAVSATAQTVVDTNASQDMGAVCAGIGVSGTDEADYGASRIGTGVTTDLQIEDGDGVGV